MTKCSEYLIGMRQAAHDNGPTSDRSQLHRSSSARWSLAVEASHWGAQTCGLLLFVILLVDYLDCCLVAQPRIRLQPA